MHACNLLFVNRQFLQMKAPLTKVCYLMYRFGVLRSLHETLFPWLKQCADACFGLLTAIETKETSAVPYEKALACLAASISAASPSTISMHGESITSALVTTLSTGHTWQGIYCLLAQLIHCQVGFIGANTEWVECKQLSFAKVKTTFFPIFCVYVQSSSRLCQLLMFSSRSCVKMVLQESQILQLNQLQYGPPFQLMLSVLY